MEYYLIILLPFLAFVLTAFFGSFLGSRGSGLLTSSCSVLSAFLSWTVFLLQSKGDIGLIRIPILRFLDVGPLYAEWALRIDTLTLLMLVVVNTVSCLVHLYSTEYMKDDPHQPRFFCWLSLFTFSMLVLVTSDNLIQMFFGWEAVGLSSFLLIGFWYKKPSANAAAIKAFVVNRVGDFGFIVGIIGVYILFQSVEFDKIFSTLAQWSSLQQDNHEKIFAFSNWTLTKGAALNLVSFLLFVGAIAKSAQVPLHTWLSDAMEGPTPVSALIHAATMVTAGVFMVARFSALFELSPFTLSIILSLGAITAFLAATIGLVQNDIKRVIAWSTCSQLGYMFVGLGSGAYGAAVFHLFTHAFFKALLFLGAGSVIHAVSGEQDMRKMGGLKHHIPITYSMMILGTLALTGVGIPFTFIGFSGFFSKDALIESVFTKNGFLAEFAFLSLLVSACLTSFYSWRLIFMTFHGTSRIDPKNMHHLHESPFMILMPLFLLSVGAVFAGFVFYDDFIGKAYDHFWKGALFTSENNTVLHAFHHVPAYVKLSPFVAMLLGFFVSSFFYLYAPWLANSIAQYNSRLYRFLVNGWYFDRVYTFLFVHCVKNIGTFLWKKGDKAIIDGFGPDGVRACVADAAQKIGRMQTGYVHHYAFAMFFGVSAFISWIVLRNLLQ